MGYEVDEHGQIKRPTERTQPSEQQNDASESNGCFVATVVYGNADAEEVKLLRLWRDQVLRHYLLGKIFIEFYYRVGKTASVLVDKNSLLKRGIRSGLDVFSRRYLKNKLGYERH